MPLVSVIMPAFNAEDTIAQAIESALAQTMDDLELIIVDDASNDSTLDIIERYADRDSRIRIFSTGQTSGGPAIPRNMALAQSSSRYIALLDADDVWAPRKTERQLAAMEAANAAISCTGFDVINAQGTQTGSFMPPVHADYSTLLKKNTIGCLTAIYDAERLGHPLFPVCGHEDYALWLELTRRGEGVLGLGEKLASYRVSAGSLSRNKIKVARFFWQIYRQREEFSRTYSTYLCARYAVLNAAKYYRDVPSHPYRK